MTDIEDAEHEVAQRALDQKEQASLFREVGFGLDVQVFLRSDIGRYLCERAEEERVAALEELAIIDHTDATAVLRLQCRIKILDSWQGWLAEAVTVGQTAEKTLNEQGA